MVQAIVVPADLSEPIRLEQLDKHDAGAFRRIVGGRLEAVQLTDPAAGVYFNDEGKLQELPINHRLTMLLWMHNSRYRGKHAFAGDGLIVGPPDRHLLPANDEPLTLELSGIRPFDPSIRRFLILAVFSLIYIFKGASSTRRSGHGTHGG